MCSIRNRKFAIRNLLLDVCRKHVAQDAVVSRIGDVERLVEEGDAFGVEHHARTAEGLRDEAGGVEFVETVGFGVDDEDVAGVVDGDVLGAFEESDAQEADRAVARGGVVRLPLRHVARGALRDPLRAEERLGASLGDGSDGQLLRDCGDG